MRDLSLFTVLFFAIMMTVLGAWSSVDVGYEYGFNAQAQMAVERQQDQQQSISSLAAPSTTGALPSIEITSHSSGQQVGVGPLTISGTSSDTPSIDCEVFADWNDNKPFGKAVAAGPGGPDDYSKWTFTYGTGYHLIKNGTNNLTSKISCVDEPINSTKWSSINLIGVDGLNSTGDSDSTINQAITTGLPPPPSSIGLPLPTPNQAGVTSTSLDPIVGEANEDDDESNEDDDDDFDDSNVENEDNSDEEDEEDNNGSEGEDSGDNENGSGGDDGDDGDEDNDLVDFGPDGPVDFGSDGPID